MSRFQVPPPQKFSFKADDWPKWIKRFERFRIASGLETQAEENQVNALIYSMGEEAEDILVSLHLSPEEAVDFHTVKTRLDTHFVARRNIIFERAKFNQRQQEMEETVDSFHTALQCLKVTWKSALLSIMEHLDEEQYEKMLLHLEKIPKGKKTVSRQQMVQKIIEFYGEEESIIVVDDIMKNIPRNDRAVQEPLQPFVGKKKTGEKRKQEADPEPEERILQQKSAAGKKRKQEADPEPEERILQQKSAAVSLTGSEKNQVVEDSSGKTEDPEYLKDPQPDKVTSSSPWRITIAELKSDVLGELGQKSVVVGKVLVKSALRTYKTKDNEKKPFFQLGIADDSACIRVMVYGEEKFPFFKEEGYYNFRNVRVEKVEINNRVLHEKTMKFSSRSNTSKAGKFDIPQDLELEAQMLVYGQRPVVSIEAIKHLEPRSRVSAEGTVKEIWDIHSRKVEGKLKKKQEFKLEDTTGSIIITLWGQDIQQLRDVSVGDLVRVTNVTTNHYHETISLNSTVFTKIFKLQSTSYKDVQIEIIGIKSAGVQQTEVDVWINGEVNTFIVDSAVLAEELGIQQGSDFEERLLEKIPHPAEVDITGNTILKLRGMKEESKVQMRV
ncbi:uncharacterized protein LOC101161326 isoform X3 [Oryzias latipes]|uniref:uncharacterized protein LOC101161326 isoform X3 n=1 Tax=Oryzias latipes TaxID=8090 RepID=UPI000CE257F4|nr:uncharacterized protein LOC101161326 isoform X3 [Oryzias latipes]